MSNPTFSAKELLAAVERELGFRRRVFPRRVEQGQMSPEAARKQIAMFEAILEDYRVKAAAEEAQGRLQL